MDGQIQKNILICLCRAFKKCACAFSLVIEQTSELTLNSGVVTQASSVPIGTYHKTLQRFALRNHRGFSLRWTDEGNSLQHNHRSLTLLPEILFKSICRVLFQPFCCNGAIPFFFRKVLIIASSTQNFIIQLTSTHCQPHTVKEWFKASVLRFANYLVFVAIAGALKVSIFIAAT